MHFMIDSDRTVTTDGHPADHKLVLPTGRHGRCMAVAVMRVVRPHVGGWSTSAQTASHHVGDGQYTSRRRLTRVAMAAIAIAQPVKTSAASRGASRPDEEPGPVTATAAPVGSHFATAGHTFCSTPTSTSCTHASPPMTAPTVLRVSAPNATPSKP